MRNLGWTDVNSFITDDYWTSKIETKIVISQKKIRQFTVFSKSTELQKHLEKLFQHTTHYLTAGHLATEVANILQDPKVPFHISVTDSTTGRMPGQATNCITFLVFHPKNEK